jgi:hypothetical protein
MTTASFSMSASADNENINAFADCGIGAGIFDNDTAAIISNVIWDLGTTAVSSKISSPETCDGGEKKVTAAKFIFDSYANLEEETALGKGEHLTAMLSILSCDTASHTNVVANIRKDLGTLILDDSYSAKSKVEKSKAFFNSVVSQCEKAA